jgi:hypothetical protein
VSGLALFDVQEPFSPVHVFEPKMAQFPGTHAESREERNEGAVAKTPILIRLAGFHDCVKFAGGEMLRQVGVPPSAHSRNRAYQLRWNIAFADHEAEESSHSGYDSPLRGAGRAGFPQDEF